MRSLDTAADPSIRITKSEHDENYSMVAFQLFLYLTAPITEDSGEAHERQTGAP